jgi:pimeloyl-ACP methyl ester carboxylesterase
MSPGSETANVVLVRDGFVDGSGWLRVYIALKSQGYQVTIVHNPTISLADDVEVIRRAIAGLQGPVILVGHSYGGVVITEAGNDPRVVGLVYIAAFVPDTGESVLSLIQNPPPGAPAAFMADSQLPWGLEALGGAVTQPGWRTKPSWYLVATDDRMIPPDAQRAMAKRARATVVETKGSHAVYVSQAQAVTSLIEQAVTAGIAAVDGRADESQHA